MSNSEAHFGAVLGLGYSQTSSDGLLAVLPTLIESAVVVYLSSEVRPVVMAHASLIEGERRYSGRWADSYTV